MKHIKTLFLNPRFFQAIGVIIVAFVAGFIVPAFIVMAKLLFLLLLAAVATDLLLLYRVRKGLGGNRLVPDRLSNGDNNEIIIALENYYQFKLNVQVFDEIPPQFQKRDLVFQLIIESGEKKEMSYFLRPTRRGAYSFGALIVLASSPIGFVARRFLFSQEVTVPVYPSFIQMRQYEIIAFSQRLWQAGIKKIRRIGHSQEFEHIKEYVIGDDFRTVNWKATGRKHKIMVNHYQDERSQQIYCVIDKGRTMQMPFDGLSLLDYAINASLVLSNLILKKSDKAGLITFQDTVNILLPASRMGTQMKRIVEALYNQKTAYPESDFSALTGAIKTKIAQRSLLLLFTNFETIFALQRQLPYLVSLSRQHLVVVVFFENTALHEKISSPANGLRGLYHKVIAEQLHFEKRLIVKELIRHGIQALLTPPEKLSVNVINKYLELKARNLI